MLILEEFGSFTRSKMATALDLACEISPSTFENYAARKIVANEIREFASTQSRSLDAMVSIGKMTAAEIIARKLQGSTS